MSKHTRQRVENAQAERARQRQAVLERELQQMEQDAEDRRKRDEAEQLRAQLTVLREIRDNGVFWPDDY